MIIKVKCLIVLNFYSLLVITLNCSNAFGQCNDNVFVNGTLTSIEGEDVTAQGWSHFSTPDVNDENGPINTTTGFDWTGVPIASNDGGTWQNIFGPEYIEQTVYLEGNKVYWLQFEFSAQGIKYEFAPPKVDPVGVEFYINGNLEYTTFEDSTQYTWESICYSFSVPNDSLYTLRFSPNQEMYIGIDGICCVKEKNIEDTTMCIGNSIVLDVTSYNASYLWNDGSHGASLEVNYGGLYWVNIVHEDCFTSDTILVDVIGCQAEIELPNVFTPNNDGINDLFTSIINSGVVSMHTVIINRWGNTVFETDNELINWDGGNVNDGVYYYIIEYTNYEAVEKRIHGFLTLTR